MDRFVAMQEKPESEMDHDHIAKRRARGKEKGAEKDEAPGITLLVFIQARRDELPELPKPDRRCHDDGGDERKLHPGEKSFRDRRADQCEPLDVQASHRRGEQRKNIVDEGIAGAKSNCYRQGALDQSKAELGEM